MALEVLYLKKNKNKKSGAKNLDGHASCRSSLWKRTCPGTLEGGGQQALRPLSWFVLCSSPSLRFFISSFLHPFDP